FNHARETTLSDKGFSFLNTKTEDESVRLKIIESVRNSEGDIKISPTTVDAFSTCPFDWLLSHVLKVDQEDFVLVHADPRVIGILIHNCYADLYREIEKETGTFLSEQISLYANMIHGIVEYRMDQMAKSPSAPIEPVQLWMRDYLHEFLPGIITADAENFAGWKSILIEGTLAVELPGSGIELAETSVLGGRLDRAAVSRTAVSKAEASDDPADSQSIAIIDYKKNSHVRVNSLSGTSDAPDSYQLPLYAFLLESDLSLSDSGIKGEVTHALYYDVTKRKYITICGDGKSDTENNFRRMIAIALEKAEEAAQLIQEGDFRVVPGLDRCKNCRNRDICRGRFAVQ
ncbi:PD-(D/E)XK nuclease family protein, partial [bacterium]|nr:PD-(D/E)XK nuclease family protein [bacterium]